jgi:hypothetical protein
LKNGRPIEPAAAWIMLCRKGIRMQKKYKKDSKNG